MRLNVKNNNLSRGIEDSPNGRPIIAIYAVCTFPCANNTWDNTKHCYFSILENCRKCNWNWKRLPNPYMLYVWQNTERIVTSSSLDILKFLSKSFCIYSVNKRTGINFNTRHHSSIFFDVNIRFMYNQDQGTPNIKIANLIHACSDQ